MSSVRDPIEKLGAEVEVKARVRDQEELERFRAMERTGKREKGCTIRFKIWGEITNVCLL